MESTTAGNSPTDCCPDAPTPTETGSTTERTTVPLPPIRGRRTESTPTASGMHATIPTGMPSPISPTCVPTRGLPRIPIPTAMARATPATGRQKSRPWSSDGPGDRSARRGDSHDLAPIRPGRELPAGPRGAPRHAARERRRAFRRDGRPRPHRCGGRVALRTRRIHRRGGRAPGHRAGRLDQALRLRHGRAGDHGRLREAAPVRHRRRRAHTRSCRCGRGPVALGTSAVRATGRVLSAELLGRGHGSALPDSETAS